MLLLDPGQTLDLLVEVFQCDVGAGCWRVAGPFVAAPRSPVRRRGQLRLYTDVSGDVT